MISLSGGAPASFKNFIAAFLLLSHFSLTFAKLSGESQKDVSRVLICPTNHRNGSVQACPDGHWQLQDYLTRACSRWLPASERQNFTGGRPVNLYLSSGIHKIVIRRLRPADLTPSSSWFTGLFLTCDVSLAIIGSHESTTTILIDGDGQESANVLPDVKGLGVVGNPKYAQIAFFESQQIAIRRITFQSSIWVSSVILKFFNVKNNVEVIHCRFWNLTRLLGGVLIERRFSSHLPNGNDENEDLDEDLDSLQNVSVVIANSSFKFIPSNSYPPRSYLYQTALMIAALDLFVFRGENRTIWPKSLAVDIRSCSFHFAEKLLGAPSGRKTGPERRRW